MTRTREEIVRQAIDELVDEGELTRDEAEGYLRRALAVLESGDNASVGRLEEAGRWIGR